MTKDNNSQKAESEAMPIVDAHVYLGKSINGYSLSTEELVYSMNELGIQQAVICPVQPNSYQRNIS